MHSSVFRQHTRTKDWRSFLFGKMPYRKTILLGLFGSYGITGTMLLFLRLVAAWRFSAAQMVTLDFDEIPTHRHCFYFCGRSQCQSSKLAVACLLRSADSAPQISYHLAREARAQHEPMPPT